LERRRAVRTTVGMWGNSLAVRIPKAFASELGLVSDSPVEVRLREGQVVVEPLPERGPTLEELLARVTPENLHREVDMGPARGLEAW
jgi:antitoxin MazE